MRLPLSIRVVLPLFIVFILLVPQGHAEVVKAAAHVRRAWTFGDDGVTFSNEFPQGRLNECERAGPL